MTKEFRITTQDVVGASEDDCFLDPADPAHAFLSPLGALGAEARLADYTAKTREQIQAEKESSWQMQYAKEHGIKPGSVAWNALWK